MTGLPSAIALAALGFSVFPIKAGSKFPPLWKNWPVLASTTGFNDAGWQYPNCNVGIHCEGLLVIDVDPRNGGDESLLGLDLDYSLSDTLTCLTPTGGRHLFYRLPEGHPGVPNSAGKLGAGLDVKSTRGYVVGAGSRTEKGEYRWQDPEVPIAPAPEWLVQKLGAFTPREQTEKVNVPDADDATVERATAWLAARPGAIEGQGGDAYTFATAAFLRDFGVSEAQALALMSEGWNGRCSPPWGLSELAAKVQNAYSYGTGPPGAKAVTGDDFPTVGLNVGTSAQVPTFPTGNSLLILGTIVPNSGRSGISGPVRLSNLAASRVEGPGYLVKGALFRSTYAEIYGDRGEGKTFVALDIAYHVAAGLPWMDKKTRQGTVLYLAYEGVGGMMKRAQALRQKYGDADVPLYVMSAGFNLRDQAGRQALALQIAALPEKPALIIIDTFARALMGGDENSAQDVGAFNQAVAALIESTGACVMILHHTGKDKNRGARGSTALGGAVDTEFIVDGNAITPTKQRDTEIGRSIGFKLTTVMVGFDEDDEDITSCVVDAASIRTPDGRDLQGNQLRGWDALVALSPSNEPVSLGAWRDACSEFLGVSRGSQRFYDIRRRLERMRLIVVEDGMVTRRME